MITFEESWQQGKVSENWRKANVSPVFKKVGRKTEGGETYLKPWEGDGAINPGSNFQAHKEQEIHQE